jgi:hypothetical protein
VRILANANRDHCATTTKRSDVSRLDAIKKRPLLIVRCGGQQRVRERQRSAKEDR